MLEIIKAPLITLYAILLLSLGFCVLFLTSNSSSENALQMANETTCPNKNFLFSSNASLLGRIYMTFSGKEFKTCINTVTSFYNKYNTCSNCDDFVKNPEKWNFVRVSQPKVGDIIIQHNSQTNKAYHAVILVKIKNEKFYVNHAVKNNYFKNVELKNKNNLSFYRYNSKQL